jgi:hypothetical protein
VDISDIDCNFHAIQIIISRNNGLMEKNAAGLEDFQRANLPGQMSGEKFL